MISKTRLLAQIKALRWRDVEAGLAEKPDLIGFRDDRGRNWLHLCCSVNPKKQKLKAADSVKTAGVLLKAGLDVNQEAAREGSWRATPLWFALARGENLALAKYLLERGSDPNHCLWAAAYGENLSAIRLLVANGADIDPVAEGHTPFLHAVQSNRFTAAKALLDLGADVNFQDARTAFHYMLKKGSDARHFPTLIAHGARGDLRNSDGATAADIMVRKRSPAFRKMTAQLSAS